MLFLNIMLSVFASSADTVNVSKQHLLQEVTVVASRTMNKGNKIIVQMREDENKTIDEVLASVPHVAVTESGISIDGRGKVKVLFNGHEVRMEGAALISYLQSLRSSDVSKVEVQTVADASQDANVQGGVINIVLRKQKDNGVNGSIENRLNVANTFFRNTAAVSLFSRWNKVNLYASFSNPITAKNNGEGRIKRVFNLPSYDYNSMSNNRIPARDYYWRVGGFADLTTRWNIGTEYAFTLNRLKRTTNDRTSMQTPEINMHDVLSTYTQKLRNHLHSLQADVSYKVDNEGSKVKFSTSYDVRRLRGDNVNLFENKCDSSNTASIYKVLAMDLSVFKQFTKTSNLLFGLKHNAISADNNTLYGGVSSDQSGNSNAAFEQKERIFAGYAQFAAAYKKLNYEVGLRYEYVATKELPTNIKRNYSDLFPYISMGYDIDEYGKWKVIASYSRKIARPLFSQQNPTKTQTSLFTYTIGNIALRPEYVNSIRSTFVYNNVYSLTLGVDMHSDLIREFSFETTDNPMGSYVTYINHHQENHWYAYLSLPFQPCYWFNINFNTLLCYQTIQITKDESIKGHFLYMNNTKATFRLPHNLNVEVSLNAISRLHSGNSMIRSYQRVDLLLSKTFKPRINLSLAVKNVFNKQYGFIEAHSRYSNFYDTMQGSNSRNIQLTLTYNFGKGKGGRKLKRDDNGEAERLNDFNKNNNIKL